MSRAFRVVSEKRLVVAGYDPAIVDLLPNTKVAVVNGRKYMGIPHGPDETRLMRNLGFDVPAPILEHYDWAGTTPFASQKRTAALLTSHRRAYVLDEIGTGKTRAALYAFHYLRKMGVAHKMLVVAPMSTLNVVWAAEIFQVMPFLEARVLHGTAKFRLTALADLNADVYIINPAGLAIIASALQSRKDIDVVLIDELATYRNARTKQWKNLRYALSWVDKQSYSHPRRWAWGMTGAPTPNEPADAWAQCKLLTPNTIPKSKKVFKDQTMRQVTTFRWVPKKDANDLVYAAMQPAVRAVRDQCFDLPPVMYTDREVILSAPQAKAYKQMLDDLAVQTAQGLVTAANEGIQMSKLLQISCGFVYKDGAALMIDPGPRFEVLEEIIEESPGKVIVFAPFTQTVEWLTNALTAGGVRASRIDGSVSMKKRTEIFSEFQRGNGIDVLVAHPGTMSHGVTLTAANVVVWYAPPNSLETYIQANGRITRPGQTRNQFIIHIRGTSIESRIYSRLKARNKLQGALLELFRNGA